MNDLTPREMEVVKLIGRGWVRHRIAAHLGVKCSAIVAYCAVIRMKLGVNNDVKIALMAHRLGVVRLEDIDFGESMEVVSE